MNPKDENQALASKRLNPNEVSKILQLWEERQSLRNNPSLADIAEALGISIEEASELHQQIKPKVVNEPKRESENDAVSLLVLFFLMPFIGAAIFIILVGFFIIFLFAYKMAGLLGILVLGAIITALSLLYRECNRLKSEATSKRQRHK